MGANLLRLEEDDGIERLRLGRGSDMALGGKVVQERLDLRSPHLPGVAFAMEPHKLPDPVAISAFGAAAEMPAAADDGNLVKQAGLSPHRCHSSGWTNSGMI